MNVKVRRRAVSVVVALSLLAPVGVVTLVAEAPIASAEPSVKQPPPPAPGMTRLWGPVIPGQPRSYWDVRLPTPQEVDKFSKDAQTVIQAVNKVLVDSINIFQDAYAKLNPTEKSLVDTQNDADVLSATKGLNSPETKNALAKVTKTKSDVETRAENGDDEAKLALNDDASKKRQKDASIKPVIDANTKRKTVYKDNNVSTDTGVTSGDTGGQTTTTTQTTPKPTTSTTTPKPTRTETDAPETTSSKPPATTSKPPATTTSTQSQAPSSTTQRQQPTTQAPNGQTAVEQYDTYVKGGSISSWMNDRRVTDGLAGDALNVGELSGNLSKAAGQAAGIITGKSPEELTSMLTKLVSVDKSSQNPSLLPFALAYSELPGKKPQLDAATEKAYQTALATAKGGNADSNDPAAVTVRDAFGQLVPIKGNNSTAQKSKAYGIVYSWIAGGQGVDGWSGLLDAKTAAVRVNADNQNRDVTSLSDLDAINKAASPLLTQREQEQKASWRIRNFLFGVKGDKPLTTAEEDPAFYGYLTPNNVGKFTSNAGDKQRCFEYYKDGSSQTGEYTTTEMAERIGSAGKIPLASKKIKVPFANQEVTVIAPSRAQIVSYANPGGFKPGLSPQLSDDGRKMQAMASAVFLWSGNQDNLAAYLKAKSDGTATQFVDDMVKKASDKFDTNSDLYRNFRDKMAMPYLNDTSAIYKIILDKDAKVADLNKQLAPYRTQAEKLVGKDSVTTQMKDDGKVVYAKK